VLQLLLQAGKPVKAYDLNAAFGEDGSSAKPPTVYRALEFLEKQGFAHRIESLNAYVACRHGETPHVAAFLICDCCKSSSEIEAAGSADLSALGAAQGFVLGGVTIEGRGLCAACAPKAA
jgi:Fur family zinc uptake transcriptional regulator